MRVPNLTTYILPRPPIMWTEYVYAYTDTADRYRNNYTPRKYIKKKKKSRSALEGTEERPATILNTITADSRERVYSFLQLCIIIIVGYVRRSTRVKKTIWRNFKQRLLGPYSRKPSCRRTCDKNQYNRDNICYKI